jgi:hypothetical protein
METVYSGGFERKPPPEVVACLRDRRAGRGVVEPNMGFLLRRRVVRKRRSTERVARLLLELDRVARDSARPGERRRRVVVGGLPGA